MDALLKDRGWPMSKTAVGLIFRLKGKMGIRACALLGRKDSNLRLPDPESSLHR